MKNKLKKVIAYVLSFMMLFTMSAMNISSVSAASTGSITVHTGKHDVNGVNQCLQINGCNCIRK